MREVAESEGETNSANAVIEKQGSRKDAKNAKISLRDLCALARGLTL